jgi:hypothetical protein
VSTDRSLPQICCIGEHPIAACRRVIAGMVFPPSVVTQIFISWNGMAAWLRQIEGLRRVALDPSALLGLTVMLEGKPLGQTDRSLRYLTGEWLWRERDRDRH